MEALDLLISFDDTGSMSSVRRQVRNKVNELVTNLFKDIPGLRVGIIIHNDYCDYPRHIYVHDFTTELKSIIEYVNQDSPCGGGDAPECYELALHFATTLSWKSDKKAMIMIGDEIPHNIGYIYHNYSRNLECENDWKEETQKLYEMGVQIYGVQALGNRHATFFYEGISKMTNGIKLDLSQFQHIPTYINAIAYQQSGGLEAYENSDPVYKTNIALRGMFNKLKGGTDTAGFAEKIELLSKFQVMHVDTPVIIKEFVERNGCTFVKGRGFYQLVEREENGKANKEIIQPYKEVIFVDKETGETFSDTNWCRDQLGVPFGTKGKVYPLSHSDVMNKYDVFIQSTSYTRKLNSNTKFLYELEKL